jgi:Mg2+ and Co2+ transporter CorA
MYKSVAIRDARQSLEFNASLWRLSWVTFVFLPLTFLSGFFGMNVRLFSPPFPSISWYFVAAVPLLILVFGFWFGFRSYGPGNDLTREEYSKEELHQAGLHVGKVRPGRP